MHKILGLSAVEFCSLVTLIKSYFCYYSAILHMYKTYQGVLLANPPKIFTSQNTNQRTTKYEVKNLGEPMNSWKK